jgi:NtrC-family two-component system sensor histidine kinase KinB
VKLWQLAANTSTSGSELQFIFNEIIVKANFPIIVLDADMQPIHWRNIPGIPSNDTTHAALVKLKEIANHMYGRNGEYPLYYGEMRVNFLLYGDSEVIRELKVMPFLEIGIVLVIMIVGFIGFQNIRRSEERHIWVGMAKETAHQLGTPISSLMGWLEVIDSECETEVGRGMGKNLLGNTVDNMQVDINRLQRVANRFGMIGSIPELNECDLNELVREVVDYYQRRLPFQGKGIQLQFIPEQLPCVQLNAELFTWALENMVKNALEAVDSRTGEIKLKSKLTDEGSRVLITIQDNGKGMSAAAARKIFRPGFTTKKRGWGLGLTLVKRIIEEYHDGRIWLEKSHPGETVFDISLPVSGKKKG